MEKVALEVQEANNFTDPNTVGVDTNTLTYQSKTTEPETFVLKTDKEGNVTFWDPEGFVELCTNTDNEQLKLLLTIYNLGIIEGCRSE
ncbi:putative D14 protein [Escherichia phage JLBYU43]|uniref:D14 protein n=1 Tax=Escherichia phage JLBYU43 TaxID=2894751 RepID=A0AAE9CFK4_9CAUD|nr:putative D14 protein [Escherichia phage JLBYU43]